MKEKKDNNDSHMTIWGIFSKYLLKKNANFGEKY